MRKEEYKQIEGTDYVCRPLPGWDGVALFFDLVAMIGEPAMMMITRAFSDNEKGGADIDAGEIVGAGVYSFVSKLGAESGVKIMKQLFADVTYVKKDGNAVELSSEHEFNQHFKGETLNALRVFVWALQVNFQSFLDDSRLTGLMGRMQAAAKRATGAAEAKLETDEEASEDSTPSTSPPSSSPSVSTPTEAQV